jgi:hypothetical protein
MLCWRVVKRAGVLLQPGGFPCDFFMWGYMKDSVYSFPIEVLRERVENAATTIRNNRVMLERVEESFRGCLRYVLISETRYIFGNRITYTLNYLGNYYLHLIRFKFSAT